MMRRHQSMLSQRRCTPIRTPIRHPTTAITALGLTAGVIPRCRSVSDSGAVIITAATTGEAITAAAITVVTTAAAITVAAVDTTNRSARRPGATASFLAPALHKSRRLRSFVDGCAQFPLQDAVSAGNRMFTPADSHDGCR